ncbi:hypothetical protein SAMN04487820_101189 [Actinopolyspora mzabensis]|uniref:SH3b domain-containing protein n=1 Tax=Actinopolyspora mzabensis TaxID=995066 RepID=A0A1G8VMD2_ACTMZ|nr:hypothetical protein SAMN04487820_101189 [Actinopolyspora mzabensis]
MSGNKIVNGVSSRLFRCFVFPVLSLVFVAVFSFSVSAGTAAAEPYPCGDRGETGLCADNLRALNVRTGPATSYTALSRAPEGKSMAIDCWSFGESIKGDNIWYYITWVSSFDGHSGFVTGYYLNTGPDPAPGIPQC